jgi:hypothetical protein
MDGQLTRDLETGILKALKKRGAVFAKAAGIERFDGWTEAWTDKSYYADKLSQLVALVYEDDQEPRSQNRTSPPLPNDN